MPIRNTLASTVILAGALACAGVSVPSSSHAGDLDSALVRNPEWHAGNDEDRARDLRPVPKPGYGKVHRPVVTLRSSSSVVSVGAAVRFEVGSSIDGFGHVYVLSASGRVQVWMENVPIAAGQRLLFPTGGAAIQAAAPAGREDLMLIVTRNRIDGFLGYGATRSPRVLSYDHQAFKQALTAKFIDLPLREWGYARAAVEVVDRSVAGPTWGWSSSDRWAGQWEE